MSRFVAPVLLAISLGTSAQPSQTYTVTFNATWSAATHPEDFPPDPHFSRLVGATHDESVELWAPGETASDGVEWMAETGGTSTLESEIAALAAGGAAITSVVGDFIATSPGTASAILEVTRDQPLVTLVSMIAPSPDWFVGVRDLDLRDGAGWLDGVTGELFVYDAGTDSGASYTAVNADTQPREPIARIEASPFADGSGLRSVGTFSFSRLATASEPTTEAGWTVGVPFPNPAAGEARIDVTTGEPRVVAVETFDLLGRKVEGTTHALPAGAHRLSVPIAGLSAGLYVVRIVSGEDSETRRLVVR